MIDSSPMYGSSQEVIGYGLRKAALAARIFAADKVWTSSARGREQIDNRAELAGEPIRPRAGPQPAQLAGASAAAVRDEGGRSAPIRRDHDVGRTASSRGRAADARHPLDFVQVTYNPSIARPTSGSCRSRAIAASR
jgi:hypothetical protein